ncbi:MAG: DNA-3-methyladenine glycosylase [Nitrososphaera sp.]
MTDCPSASFYARPTAIVARALLGKKLVRMMKRRGRLVRLAGKIVETEAYGSDDDPASHAWAGQTRRNSVMFGDAGRAYVYFTYGNHFCINVSAKPKTEAAGAVLIRAIEPIEGIEIMKQMRPVYNDLSLGSGPGKLTQALNITSRLNGVNMTDPESVLHIEQGRIPSHILSTPRIGITRATGKNWRFLDPASSHVSRNVQIKVR